MNKMNCELMLTYDTPALRQTGSRNLTGPKTLPTIWGTYMKRVTKHQISAINSCWEKCAYTFNVYKNQLSRQTGSRNLIGPKTLPTIWGTYMKLVTKYQISAINSCWEKCHEKWAYMFNVYKNQLSRQTGSRNLQVQKRYPQYGIHIRRFWPNIRFLTSTVTEKNATKNILDGRTEVTQFTPSPFGELGYNNFNLYIKGNFSWRVHFQVPLSALYIQVWLYLSGYTSKSINITSINTFFSDFSHFSHTPIQCY